MIEAATKKVKVSPQELGFARPYTLSFSSQIFFSSDEDRAALVEYVNSYSTAVKNGCLFIESVLQSHPEAAYFLIAPKFLPSTILEHPLVKYSTEVRDSAAKAFREKRNLTLEEEQLSSITPTADYQVWRAAIFGAETKETTPGLADLSLFQRFEISIDPAFKVQFDAIFSKFPASSERTAIFSTACAKMRAFLSSCEMQTQLLIERETARQSFIDKNPLFHESFFPWVKDQQSWAQACRYWLDLRENLFQEIKKDTPKSKGIKGLLGHAQRAAMWQLRDKVPAFQGIFPIAENIVVDEKIVREFVVSLPPELPEDVLLADLFRRLSPPGNPSNLSSQPHLTSQIIRSYQDQFQCFTDVELIEMQKVEKFGRKSIHKGWSMVFKSKDKRHKALVKFISELRVWMQSYRRIEPPKREVETVAWPLFREGAGWNLDSTREGLKNQNEAWVVIEIPKMTDQSIEKPAKRAIRVKVRGNTPYLNGEQIDQIDIKNGMTQFRPNVKINNPVETLLKLQAMRVTVKKGKIFGLFSSTLMSKVLRNPSTPSKFIDHVAVAEKVMVAHFAPGGRRLISLGVFEKSHSSAGWDLLPLRQEVLRTDARKGKQTVKLRTQPFLNIEDNPYSLAQKDIETTKILETKGLKPDLAESILSKAGADKAAFSKTHYQRVAAQIARLCRLNKCSYFLIGWNGMSINRGGIVHPLKSLFSYSPEAGLTGYLVNSLTKSGIACGLTKSSAASIWVKELVKTGSLDHLHLATPFRERTKFDRASEGEDQKKIFGGEKNLLESKEGKICEFPLNSLWSILLFASNPVFKTNAEKILGK